jgi:hypothetical protein
MYYPDIFRDGLRKSAKYLNHDSNPQTQNFPNANRFTELNNTKQNWK